MLYLGNSTEVPEIFLFVSFLLRSWSVLFTIYAIFHEMYAFKN